MSNKLSGYQGFIPESNFQGDAGRFCIWSNLLDFLPIHTVLWGRKTANTTCSIRGVHPKPEPTPRMSGMVWEGSLPSRGDTIFSQGMSLRAACRRQSHPVSFSECTSLGHQVHSGGWSHLQILQNYELLEGRSRISLPLTRGHRRQQQAGAREAIAGGSRPPPCDTGDLASKIQPCDGGGGTRQEAWSPRGEKDKPALISARKWVTFIFSGIREMIILLPIVFNVEIRQSLDKLQIPGWYSP